MKENEADKPKTEEGEATKTEEDAAKNDSEDSLKTDTDEDSTAKTEKEQEDIEHESSEEVPEEPTEGADETEVVIPLENDIDAEADIDNTADAKADDVAGQEHKDVADTENEDGNESTKVILPNKPHTNKTEGHWKTILDEVNNMKESGDYSKIYVNKGLSNEIPGAKPNRRPDIMGVRRDGLIDQVEVPSKTDNPENLINRMKDNQIIMGDRAGNINIKEIGGN